MMTIRHSFKSPGVELRALLSRRLQKCEKRGHTAKFCKCVKSGSKKKFEGTCNWCEKKGHKEKQFFAKQRDKPRTVPDKYDNAEEEDVLPYNMCVVITTAHEVQELNTRCKSDCESWLADSGASSHLTNDSTYNKNY